MLLHAYCVRMIERIHGLRPHPVHLGRVHTGGGPSTHKLNRYLVLPILVAVYHGERDLATRRIARCHGVEELEGAQIRNVVSPTEPSLLLRGRQAVILVFSVIQFRILRGHAEY